MRLGNFAMELADLRAEQEREAGIKAAQSQLKGQGSLLCRGCGNEIDPERRSAMPSADRCIDCKKRLERFRRRTH